MISDQELYSLRQRLLPTKNSPYQALDKFIRPLIAINFPNVPVQKITQNANLYTDLGLDSIDRMELAMHIERTFGPKLSDAQLEHIKTIDDLCRIVCEWINFPLPQAMRDAATQKKFNLVKNLRQRLAFRSKIH